MDTTSTTKTGRPGAAAGAVVIPERTDADLDRDEAELAADLWADDDAARETLASLEAERRGDQARDERAWS